ncbi:MAG TPA: pilus assembly PilX N-terminal domain-containing protein [Actinomycetota bacterium]|nr:pilus assembly PilX N-terminal domain-containing protein [Actinomycetota bacterium]
MTSPRNERGAAMATVVFVGAALTVLTSTAVFVTVQDYRAGTDDRKATEALAYAEAGVDRMIQYLRAGPGINFGVLRRKGCEDPKLTVPQGSLGSGKTFDVTLEVFDPLASTAANRFPIPPSSGACATRSSDPRRGQFFLITSTGQHPASKRVVQQVVQVGVRALPIGLVGDDFDTNGTPDITGISIIASGDVFSRDKLDLDGLDAYYTLEDFWPGATWPAGVSGNSRVPAAAHAVGRLVVTPNKDEFPPNPNCGANKSGSNKQSLWDSDGSAGSGPISAPLPTACSGQPFYSGAFPPTSKFTQADYDRLAAEELTPEDFSNMKASAMEFGQYCFIPLSGSSYCIRQGTQIGYTEAVSPIVSSGTNNFVAFYEFEGGDRFANEVRFNDSSVWSAPTGCSTDPAVNKSMVLVVRNGGVRLGGNTKLNGAIFADGNFDYTGTPSVNGPISAANFWVRGTANFTLDQCWVQNMPWSFLTLTPVQWSEVDR